MADSTIPVTGGSGYNVDTRTESTNSNHRQVVVLGDSSANGGLATVDATNGLSVTLTTALPAGTAAIGKLAVNDGVDVGDVTINNAVGAGVFIRPGTGINLDTSNITVATSALPSGAATAAHQITQNTSLSAIVTSVQLLDDAVYTDGTGTPSKALAVAGTDGTNPQIISTNVSGHINVADGGNSITVDGAVSATQSGSWNVTNISGTVSLPTGASTSAKQDTIITSVQLIDDAIYTDATGTPTVGIAVMGTDGTNPQLISVTTAGLVNIADGGGLISIDDGAGSLTVDGTITANLGTIGGASTAVKQPALGTAGTASTDVITVQGIASMTALRVDGAGGTFPVSGTVTANAGTGFAPVITAGSAAGTTGIHILGTDGTNGRIISTNSTGHINIADGGNSITVDNGGTFATQTTQSGVWSVRLTDGTDTADVLDLTNSNPLTVAIVDAAGTQITSFGGGTQYTEDAVSASDPVGNMLIVRRRDTLTGAEVSADSDNIAVNATSKGELYVKQTDVVPVSDNSGSLTVDAPVGTPAFVRLSDGTSAITTLPVSLASVPSHPVTNAGTFAVQAAATQSGAWSVTSYPQIYNGAAFESMTGEGARGLDSNIKAIGGSAFSIGQQLAAASIPIVLTSAQITTLTPPAAITGFATSARQDTLLTELQLKADLSETQPVSLSSVPSHAVTNAGTFAVQVDGAALTSLQLADDVVATLGTTTYTEATTKGTTIGAVRRDADTTLVDTTNEIGPLQMDANGRLKVEVFSGESLPVTLASTTVTGTVAVTQSGTWNVTQTTASNLNAVVFGYDGATQRALNTDSNGELQVDVLTMPTVTVNAHAVTNSGTFVTQENGAALTALQLIDDTVIADNAGFTDGTTRVEMAGYVFDETAGTALTENDAAAARIDSKRSQVMVIEDATTRGQRVSVNSFGALHINQSYISGTATNVGNGSSSAGVQRVTIASDSTGNIATIGTSVTPGTTATNLGKAEDAGHTTADTGVFALAVRNNNAATTVTSADGDYSQISVDGRGVSFTTPASNTTSTLANVAGSASTVTILALNAARKGASVHNDSTVILYLKLGATASVTSYTIKMQPDDYYEVPFNYSGVMDGIWASATGSARVTEIT